jgi:Ser/Thr protein kinase RdoA (MazF antagonist)
MKYVPADVLAEYAQRYGIAPESLVKFAGGEDWNDGTVYAFTIHDKTHLLKVMELSDHADHGAQRLDERLTYLDYLRAHDAPVIHPVHSKQGRLVERVSHNELQFQAYAWQKVEGSRVEERDIERLGDFHREWGRTVGRMHALAQGYPDWRESPLCDEFGQSIASYRTEMDFFAGWLKDDDVRAVWSDLRHELGHIPVHRQNFGFIHNDPHTGNLLLNERGVFLLDFDVANYHWFMVDLAIMVYSEIYRLWNRRPMALHLKQRIVGEILEGYARANTLAQEEIDRMELFLLYRRIIMFCVFYDQIRTNAPEYLRGMKDDILHRRKLLDSDRT